MGNVLGGCCFFAGRTFASLALLRLNLFTFFGFVEGAFLSFAFADCFLFHGALGELGHGLILLDRCRSCRWFSGSVLWCAIGQDAKRRHIGRRVNRGALCGIYRFGNRVRRGIRNRTPTATPIGGVLCLIG